MNAGQAAMEREGGPRLRDAKRDVRLSIVLPAYDEEQNIETAIGEATAAAERLVAEHEIIVVDDGSVDATAALVRAVTARDPRVRLVEHDRNRGYGEALRSGFLASRLDFVFFTDADLQFDMGELALLLPYAGTVDVVAGYRLNRQDAIVRRVNAYGWNLLVRVCSTRPCVTSTAPSSCSTAGFSRRSTSSRWAPW